MPDNQLFSDWVTGETIDALRLNRMKNELAKLDTPVFPSKVEVSQTLGVSSKGYLRMTATDGKTYELRIGTNGRLIVFNVTDSQTVLSIEADGLTAYLGGNKRVKHFGQRHYGGVIGPDKSYTSGGGGGVLIGQLRLTGAFGSTWSLKRVSYSFLGPGGVVGLQIRETAGTVKYTAAQTPMDAEVDVDLGASGIKNVWAVDPVTPTSESGSVYGYGTWALEIEEVPA